MLNDHLTGSSSKLPSIKLRKQVVSIESEDINLGDIHPSNSKFKSMKLTLLQGNTSEFNVKPLLKGFRKENSKMILQGSTFGKIEIEPAKGFISKDEVRSINIRWEGTAVDFSDEIFSDTRKIENIVITFAIQLESTTVHFVLRANIFHLKLYCSLKSVQEEVFQGFQYCYDLILKCSGTPILLNFESAKWCWIQCGSSILLEKDNDFCTKVICDIPESFNPVLETNVEISLTIEKFTTLKKKIIIPVKLKTKKKLLDILPEQLVIPRIKNSVSPSEIRFIMRNCSKSKLLFNFSLDGLKDIYPCKGELNKQCLMKCIIDEAVILRGCLESSTAKYEISIPISYQNYESIMQSTEKQFLPFPPLDAKVIILEDLDDLKRLTYQNILNVPLNIEILPLDPFGEYQFSSIACFSYRLQIKPGESFSCGLEIRDKTKTATENVNLNFNVSIDDTNLSEHIFEFRETLALK